MDAVELFQQEKEQNIRAMTQDSNTNNVRKAFMDHVGKYKYGYYSTWMGRPIIQLPQDMIALQELVMTVQPDLIIETGIAHGGSIIYSASLLALLDIYSPVKDLKREVVGIDIEIRPHNRKAIEEHAMYERITMLEGSSVAQEILKQVKEIAMKHKKVMVLLDSCHTHEHVLNELREYAPLVSKGSYIVVYDTAVEFVDASYSDRPWGKGNNLYTAVQSFLQENNQYELDINIENKYVLTSCPGGWLKKIL